MVKTALKLPRSSAITLAACLVLAVLAAQAPLLLGRFYAGGDARDVFVPLEHFFHSELLAGRLPAWHPDVAWGFPVIASAQLGFFYPPLLLLRLLPLPWYLTLLVLSHLIALALGAYLWLRAQRLSPPAAYLGAVSFALSGFFVQHLTHSNIITTAAWLPWQLLAVHRVASRTTLRARDAALLAIALALPILAGQLHIPALLSLNAAAYFIFIRIKERRSLRQSVGVLAMAAIAASLLSAVQLLPTAELVLASSRGPAGDFNLTQANQHSFPLYHLPTILFPRFFGHDDTYWGKRLEVEYGLYIGTMPFVLSLYALRRRRQPPDAYFRALLVVSLLLALGGNSPFRWLGLEPSLWVFSAPARWLLFSTFALSYLAAQGFDVLTPRHRLRGAAVLASIAAAAVLFASLALYTVDESSFTRLAERAFWGSRALPDSYYDDKLSQLLNSARQSSLSLASPYTALPVILLVSLPLLWGRRRGRQVVLAVTTIELIVLAASANPTLPWRELLVPSAAVNALPALVRAGQARVLSLPELGDTGLYFTNPASRLSVAERTAHYRLLPPLTHALFAIPGVEWPASLALAGHAAVLDAMRDAGTGALHRRELAEDANIGAVLTPIAAGGGAIIQPLTPRSRASGDASIEYQPLTPGRVRLTVDAPSDTAITVRDSFYPGWRAYQDGQRIPIARDQHIFRRVDVTAGRHQIEFRYVPVPLYAGLTISVLALIACSILILKRMPL